MIDLLLNSFRSCGLIALFWGLTAFTVEHAQPARTAASPANAEFVADLHLSGEVPREVARKFRRDASRLALRIASGGEDFRYLGIYIPKENIDLIFNALASVYQADERGKGLEKCNIHTFPNPSIDHLVVIYNKNVAWARPLQQGLTETDSRAVNDLLDRYGLVIEKHVNWTDEQDAITIRSTNPLNMAAVANEFNNIEGVDEIDLGIPKVVGNDIAARRVSGAWELDYVLRFGSWASGKGKSHTWKYRVADNGKVTFVNESGEPVPEWMKCERPGREQASL